MSEEEHNNAHTQRDGETLFVLVLFLVILGLPVILGSFWSDTSIQKMVCAISGLVLCGIGTAFVVHGKKVLKRLN